MVQPGKAMSVAARRSMGHQAEEVTPMMALLIGILLALLGSIALQMGSAIPGNTCRALQFHGIKEKMSLSPGETAIFFGRTLGAVIDPSICFGSGVGWIIGWSREMIAPFPPPRRSG